MKFLHVIVCLVLICSNSNSQFLDDSPYGLAGRNQEISNMSVSHDVGDDVLPHVLEDSNNDVAERAKQALTTDIIDPKYDVSDVCLNHTKLFLGGLVSRKQWALRSKYRTGISVMKFPIKKTSDLFAMAEAIGPAAG